MTTILAISAMSAGWTAVWYIVAFLLAVLATFGARWPNWNLLAAAFAAFLIPSMWNALSSA